MIKNKNFKVDNLYLYVISIVFCLFLIFFTLFNFILVLYVKYSYQKFLLKYFFTFVRFTLIKADKIFVFVFWFTMFFMWVGFMNCSVQRKLMRTVLMVLYLTVVGLFRIMWQLSSGFWINLGVLFWKRFFLRSVEFEKKFVSR